MARSRPPRSRLRGGAGGCAMAVALALFLAAPAFCGLGLPTPASAALRPAGVAAWTTRLPRRPQGPAPRASASPSGAAPAAQPARRRWRLLVPVVIGGLLAALPKAALAASKVTVPPLSGVGESLSAILLSELGDKTFFLTVVLAVRRGRVMALAAACTALWLMTGISSCLGVMLRTFPEALVSQRFIDLSAAALMVLFGIQALRESRTVAPKEGDKDCGSEKDEAECEIDEALVKGVKAAGGDSSWVRDWFQFSVLIFLAEWGDRSMLATVTLAATRSPFGVFLGGCIGHLSAAILAVACANILEKYVSERFVKVSSGVLFLIFGVTTALGVY